jgi:hypothetical protein
MWKRTTSLEQTVEQTFVCDATNSSWFFIDNICCLFVCFFLFSNAYDFNFNFSAKLRFIFIIRENQLSNYYNRAVHEQTTTKKKL